MNKNHLTMKFLLLILAVLGIFMTGCTPEDVPSRSHDGTGNLVLSFRLEVRGTYYHGEVDNDARTVTVRGIGYGTSVTGVSYALSSGASISPDPETLVGEWPESTEFTVSDGRDEYVYTVSLPDYISMEPGPEGEVLFEDDFEQESSVPDPAVWTYCPPGSSAWSRHMSGSPDQTFIEDGKLVFVAEKVDGVYKAGGVQTQNKEYWGPGTRVEVNARFVKCAQGAWPAIWLMPQNAVYPGWPDCGEIDIMELLNHDDFVYQTVHSHYLDDLGMKDPAPAVTPSYNKDTFNTYAVDLTDDAIIFYVNGQETHSYPNLHLDDESVKMQWPFSCDFYLILNLALGGEGTWPGAIYDEELPARMEIDWVRVSKIGE